MPPKEKAKKSGSDEEPQEEKEEEEEPKEEEEEEADEEESEKKSKKRKKPAKTKGKAAKKGKKEGKKERKPRKKKDPNAPKRPKSAWMYFGEEMRPKIKVEHPGVQQKEILQLLGEKWKELTDEEKEPYQKKAKKDKNRYETEKANYKPKKDDDDDEEES